MKTIKLQFTDFERQINKSINEDWTAVHGHGFCDVEHMTWQQAASHAFWSLTKQHIEIGIWLSYNDLEAFWKGDLNIGRGDVIFVKKGKNKFGL